MRVFWLGMHKILTATELPRLRHLGYEVFNPPYLSDVYDQSANVDWDRNQPTTLPEDVFAKLSKYNFFYNQINDEIAELLNSYFDAVIVTINPQWLASVVRRFRKKIIYRTYGQTYQICAHLVGERVWTEIIQNPDFHFVPFAAETIIGEHRWLTDRSVVVPYSLPFDVYEFQDTWALHSHTEEVMVSVPNIDHPYYGSMYNHLNVHFPGMYLRMYGVQAKPVDDFRVAGTLPRRELLQAYQRAAGYFYPYQDFNVCYLPPIEMMTIGGPVVYAENSLLHRFTNGNDPGVVRGIDEQRRGIERLRRHDHVYVQEVVAAQKDLVARYHPDRVYPIFDEIFRRLLDDPGRHTILTVEGASIQTGPTKLDTREAWILCHWPGHLIHEHVETGSLFAIDGISRVITKIIDALLSESSYIVVATCYAYQAPLMVSYYAAPLKSGRMRLCVLDPENMSSISEGEETEWSEIFTFVVRRQFKAASSEEGAAAAVAGQVAARMRLVETINTNPRAAVVFVPHYYHFAETLRLNARIISFIPDYMPHFYPGVVFEGDVRRDEENASIGRRLAKKAEIVMTTSWFTESYLAESALKVRNEKIRVLPIPLVNGALPTIASGERSRLSNVLAGARFLFYPTANRPNKELSFLLRIYQEIKREAPDVRLVLTCSLQDYKPVEDTARTLGLTFDGDPSTNDIVLFTGTHEGTLRWLYEGASALCFTSTMEGNFPPQIIEALHYNTPIVATRLPHVVEVLKEDADFLFLCAPKNAPDFLTGLRTVLRNPDLVRERQLPAKRTVCLWNSIARFNRMGVNLFYEAEGRPCIPIEVHHENYYNEGFLPFGLVARLQRVLTDAPSDHAFSHRLHDLLLSRTPTIESVREHVRLLESGCTKEQLVADILAGLNWPDECELTYAQAWLAKRQVHLQMV
jgi:glycosyltransferase involved in cell wall biosynthesis